MADIDVGKLRTQAESGAGCKVKEALNTVATMDERTQILRQMAEQSKSSHSLHQLHLSETPEGAGLEAAIKLDLKREVPPSAGKMQKFLSEYVWGNSTENLYSEKHFYLKPNSDTSNCNDRH